jgi:G:T-mismatch repair DNA endonuclease (very short patch repair protein)
VDKLRKDKTRAVLPKLGTIPIRTLERLTKLTIPHSNINLEEYLISCKICNSAVQEITTSHIKGNYCKTFQKPLNLDINSIEEYRKKYPNSTTTSNNMLKIRSKAGKIGGKIRQSQMTPQERSDLGKLAGKISKGGLKNKSYEELLKLTTPRRLAMERKLLNMSYEEILIYTEPGRIASTKNVLPTKLELKIDRICKDNNFPYKYTGNLHDDKHLFKLDFTHNENSLKCIEVHGCYWHGCTLCYQLDSKRTERLNNAIIATVLKMIKYKNEGYKILEIWEHELVDKQSIINKIQNF